MSIAFQISFIWVEGPLRVVSLGDLDKPCTRMGVRVWVRFQIGLQLFEKESPINVSNGVLVVLKPVVVCIWFEILVGLSCHLSFPEI